MSRSSGNRKERRVEAVYPVRLWGMDANGKPFIEAATTLNVSRNGALVKNAPKKLKVGETVGLRVGDQKCRFQIVWVGRNGTLDDGYIGLKAVDRERRVWEVNGLEDPGDDIDTYIRPPQRENRLLKRLQCSISAEIASGKDDARVRAFVTDISIGGCYISMPSPCALESKLTIALWLDYTTKIHVDGIVLSRHAGVGMGIKFLNLSRKNFDELSRLIEQLSNVAPVEA